MAKQARQVTIEQAVAFLASRDPSIFQGDSAYRKKPAADSLAVLRDALIQRRITATGSVDTAAERAIAPGEWANYVFEPSARRQAGLTRCGGGPHWFVKVRSTKSFRAQALNDHSYPSATLVPAAESPAGSSGFYRTIVGIRLLERDVSRLAAALPRQSRATSRTEKEFQRLIDSEIKKSPKQPLTKSQLVAALTRAGHVTTVRSKAFERARLEAIKANKATAPAWANPHPGSPKGRRGPFSAQAVVRRAIKNH